MFKNKKEHKSKVIIPLISLTIMFFVLVGVLYINDCPLIANVFFLFACCFIFLLICITRYFIIEKLSKKIWELILLLIYLLLCCVMKAGLDSALKEILEALGINESILVLFIYPLLRIIAYYLYKIDKKA